MNYPAASVWQSFEKIIVTGPQRSGTRICARMIAHDTGYEYVDEKALSIDRVLRLWDMMHSKRRLVVQCPALCRHAHMFSRPEVAIVLMCRDIDDIRVSERRIGWKRHGSELARYDLREGEGEIAVVKYKFWADYQRERIAHPFEIDYESLAGHPLWVSKAARAKFGPHQTRRGK